MGHHWAPMVPDSLPGSTGQPRVSWLVCGNPRLTFNTGCTWDFQWMRVSLWSCENLGRQQRQGCRLFPCFPSASILLPGLPRRASPRPWCRDAEGAWGLSHNTKVM